MKKLDGTNVPIIRGWGIYNKDELKRIRENNELAMIYAGVSAKCDINCIYCVTKSGTAVPGEMNLEERKDLYRQAKDLDSLAGPTKLIVTPSSSAFCSAPFLTACQYWCWKPLDTIS